MLKKIFLALFFIGGLSIAHAQTFKLNGTVTDDHQDPLAGVDIIIKGTQKGTITDENGKFSLQAEKGQTLSFSFVGFQTQDYLVRSNAPINISLKEGVNLDEIVVIGSRNKNRTSLETAVPVDVLDLNELSVSSAQVNPNQLLNYVAPSFSSQPQIVSDGTDHIDPASLRGLGPDQVLVLINGKRRHTSALVNVNGTPGRGAVGTDLNAIPIASIERIEILRDGASAQYGSDAIAGVINIVLKKNVNNLDVSFHSGANMSANGNNFEGGIDGEEFQFNLNRGMALGKNGGYLNLTATLNSRNRNSRSRPFTGQIFNGYNAIEWVAFNDNADLSTLQNDLAAIQNYAQGVTHFDANLKADIAAAGDIQTIRTLLSDANNAPTDFSDAELIARGMDRSDFQMNIGQPQLREGKFFLNMSLPLGESRFYAFGGLSHRKSVGFAYYRRPTQERTYTPLYINGLRPEGRADVDDISFSLGLEQDIKGWHTDFSNTWGTNRYKFVAALSTNSTLQSASPPEFDSWNMAFTQNTTNFDISRFWDNTFKGLNVALGTEFRLENYQIFEADATTWGIYNVNGQLIENFNLVADSLKVTDFFGRVRPGGAQAFPGFRPENAVDAFRQSLAAYADVEVDFTNRWMMAGAARFEDYSDFGSTLNFKLASRYKLTSNLAARASVSTGFRAPSLHQINFSSVSTQFINGIGAQVLTASNTSTLARALGIKELKQETSQDISLGITGKIPAWGLTFSADAYRTRINDRVVLTDMFTQTDFAANGRQDLVRALVAAGAEKVQFFTNAIDTETQGIEVVVSQTSSISSSARLSHNLGASFLQTKRVGSIQSSAELVGYEETYFGERSRIFLEEAVPRTKINLAHTLSFKKWSINLNNTYFGKVTEAEGYVATVNGPTLYPVFDGKTLTDLSLTFHLSKTLKWTIGGNNILDIYPDERPEQITDGNQFIYSRRTAQFGSNGRYVFMRFNLSI